MPEVKLDLTLFLSNQVVKMRKLFAADGSYPD